MIKRKISITTNGDIIMKCDHDWQVTDECLFALREEGGQRMEASFRRWQCNKCREVTADRAKILCLSKEHPPDGCPPHRLKFFKSLINKYAEIEKEETSTTLSSGSQPFPEDFEKCNQSTKITRLKKLDYEKEGQHNGAKNGDSKEE